MLIPIVTSGSFLLQYKKVAKTIDFSLKKPITHIKNELNVILLTLYIRVQNFINLDTKTNTLQVLTLN